MAWRGMAWQNTAGQKQRKPPLTSLADQQEEPHAAGQVQQQRDGIARVPQQVDDGEEGAVGPGPEPAGPDGRRVEQRVRRGPVVLCGAADEGRGEAPGHADHEEPCDVVERPGLLLCG